MDDKRYVCIIHKYTMYTCVYKKNKYPLSNDHKDSNRHSTCIRRGLTYKRPMIQGDKTAQV